MLKKVFALAVITGIPAKTWIDHDVRSNYKSYCRRVTKKRNLCDKRWESYLIHFESQQPKRGPHNYIPYDCNPCEIEEKQKLSRLIEWNRKSFPEQFIDWTSVDVYYENNFNRV